MRMFLSALALAFSTGLVMADEKKDVDKAKVEVHKSMEKGDIRQPTGVDVPGCTQLLMTPDGKLVVDCQPWKHEAFERDHGQND